MAKTHTTQYQPTTTSETSVDDGLSVRFARDVGIALNNYKYHAGNHKIIGEMFNPYITSTDDTVLTLRLYLGKWYIPSGFRQVRWWLNGKLTNGDDQTTWTLVSATDFYKGPAAYDATYLSGVATSTIDITSSGWQKLNNALTLDRPDFNGYRWFYLLAQNDTGGTNPATRSSIVAIDVQPLVT